MDLCPKQPLLLCLLATATLALLTLETMAKPSALHLIKVDETSVKCVWYTTSVSDVFVYDATCQWGSSPAELDKGATGRSYSYIAGGFNGSLHEVTFAKLELDRLTFYRCGSEKPNETYWSDVSHFTLRPRTVSDKTRIEESTWIGMIGDMGVEESQHTMESLWRESQSSTMDLVVHAGDISYADDYIPSDHNSYIWIKYMQEVEGFAASGIYMTCPGNHEAQFDFAAYTNWLPMPSTQSHSPFYHSFDHTGVHFTMMSTEHDFSPGSTQYEWIERDLEKAFLQRHVGVPWLVVVGHRPLYCSSLTLSRRCTEEAPMFRKWLEPLLHRWKVDAYICGHNHQYERSYPVFNATVMGQSYVRPNATVYIVNGAAGNRERNDDSFMPEKDAPWRAAHGDLDTGWMRVRASTTQLQFEYLLSKTGRVTDHFTIVR